MHEENERELARLDLRTLISRAGVSLSETHRTLDRYSFLHYLRL